MDKSKKRILIIDDNREVRETLGCLLGEFYEVLPARYAKEGLKMLSRDIGLVLLDYMLPDSNGLEALAQIKKAYPAIPVIFITGHGSEDVCLQAFRTGARDYIKKPFDKDEILAKADVLMKTRDSREERHNIFHEPSIKTIEASGERIPHHILFNILKAKDYLDENYTKQIELTDALKIAGLSKTYFCSYFKRITGYSFTDYCNYIKVERAKDFLINEHFSIDDIATVLGYSSVNYFTEVFKKFSGDSPAEFRKKMRD